MESQASEIREENERLKKRINELMVEVFELTTTCKDLDDSDKMLTALLDAGVYNWSGYDYALELLGEME